MPNVKMERFTQRARRVLSLAQEEAEQLRHSYIGTEHLLMGLLREEGGIAGRVLRDLGLEERRVREMVESLSPANDRHPVNSAELTPATKRVLEMAVDEARRMGHNYIGTEHLLLGLVRQSDGVAIDVLKRLGISPEEVRRQTRRTLQEQPAQAAPRRQPPPKPQTPLTAPTSESYEIAKMIINKLMDMVGDKKMSMQQTAELVSAIVPELKLTNDEKAQLIAYFFRPDQLEGYQVKFKVSERQSGEVKLDWETPLAGVLDTIDSFLGAVLLSGTSTGLTFNDGPLHFALQIKKNSATQPPPPPTSDEKE